MVLVIQNNNVKIQPHMRYLCPINLNKCGLEPKTVLKILHVCLVVK